MSRFVRRSMCRSGLAWSVLAGGAFGLAGFLAAMAALHTPLVGLFGSEWPELPYAAALASVLVGGVCWWLAVERPGRPIRSRGALVGLLTGLLAHPVTWTFLFVYQDPSALANLLQDGTLAAVFLFTYYGLALTGVVTVGVGIVCGLAVTVARERVETRDDGERERLGVVAGVYFVWGVLALPVALLAMTVPRPFVVSLILATLVPVPVLRRLPVVRTFLLQSYRLDEDSHRSLVGASFLLRHAVVMVPVGVGYFVALLAYSSLTWEFFARSSAPISQGISFVTLFPLLFVASSLPAALAANYLANRWEPIGTLPRATREWLTFLLVVVAVYAAGSAVLFGPFDL